MEYKDYYKVLGVARTANADEIRAAYRKLAMQYHPDRNPGDKQAEDRFKDINEAYQALSDPQKRARYDQIGDSYSRWQQSGSGGGFDWSQFYGGQGSAGTRVDYNDLFGSGAGADVFSDFFRTIFGGGGGFAGETTRRAAPRGMEQPVQITLEEAYHGTSRQLQSAGRNLKVSIPQGVKTGSKVRVAGGAPDGSDLYLKINIAPDARFEREGNDLHTSTTIDVFTALLGGEADVQTLTGKVHLTIPPGTQPEQVFRVSGRGMPHLKSPETKGALYVRVHVRIPRDLSEAQKALIEQARKG
jgi:curved DNA-binding protein